MFANGQHVELTKEGWRFYRELSGESGLPICPIGTIEEQTKEIMSWHGNRIPVRLCDPAKTLVFAHRVYWRGSLATTIEEYWNIRLMLLQFVGPYWSEVCGPTHSTLAKARFMVKK